MPRLPQLRFDKRMQLIRLNNRPNGGRGNGLFVVLFEEAAERAEGRPRSTDLVDHATEEANYAEAVSIAS